MKNFLESTVPMQVSKIMLDRNYGWGEHSTLVTIKTLIEGFAVYLGRNKSKDTPVAATLVGLNDKFYFQKQDEEGADEGSWTLSMTFDEKDIDYDNWTVAKYPHDPVLSGIIYDVGFTRYGANFVFSPKDNVGTICEGSPQELFCTIVDVIVDYMRANVSIDPQLELTNYFTITATLETDGSVYLGVEPSALMKQHVKDDSDIDSNQNASNNIASTAA